jgi:hypothetical protein
MRCLGRGFGFATADARLALIGFRAEVFALVLRAGDFFSAAVFAAARDFGFFLAIDVLPFDLREKASTVRASE